MKKLIPLLFILVLVTAVLPAYADGWTCVNGHTGNTGRFCTECGAAQPEPLTNCPGCGAALDTEHTPNFCPACGYDLRGAPAGTPVPTGTPEPAAAPVPARALKITSVSTEDGLSAAWTDNRSDRTYTVYYTRRTQDTFDLETAVHSYIGALAQETPALSAKDADAVLYDGDWWLIVFDDADYAYDGRAFTYRAPVYNEFGKITSKPTLRVRKDRDSKSSSTVKQFSASDIQANIEKSGYGMSIKQTYSQLKKKRTVREDYVITYPNGDITYLGYGNNEYPAGRTYSTFAFFDITEAFEECISRYGTVPTGTWTWTQYTEGGISSSFTFEVGK